MKKRGLSLFLVLALCLTLLPAPVRAEEANEGDGTTAENVAEVTIGETTTQYTDLNDAFTAASGTDSATLKLLADVETSYAYTVESGSHTLDLNGCTLTSNTADDGFLYISGGTLTIQDSGKDGAITSVNSTLRVNSGGKLIVTGGSFTSQNTNGLIVFNGGSAQLSGGTFSTTNPNEAHSIWVMDSGKAANLLVDGCRYMDAVDTAQKSSYSNEGNGVVGATTVCKIPEGEVTFIGADGSEQTQPGCKEITAGTTELTDSGWYAVKENVTVNGDLTISADNRVHLILCDGATLTVSGALSAEGGKLNLYFQENGSGKLTAGTVNGQNNISAPAGEMKTTAGTGSLTFERCLKHDWEYTNNDDTHTKTCALCGTDGGTVGHSFDKCISKNADGHTYACVCGATSTEDHTLSYVITDATHKQVCDVCDYATAEAAHSFAETTGKCVCGADADVAEDKVKVTITPNGGTPTTKTYTDLLEAFKDADDPYATVEVTLLQSGKTYTLDSTKPFPIEFEYAHGVEVIVDLNGCTLKRSVEDSTYGILKVEEGNVTFKNGTLDLDDSKAYNAAQAIKMPSGGNPTLTLENMTVTVTDHIDEEVSSIRTAKGYAIRAEDGTLNIKSGTYGKVRINNHNSAKAQLSGGSYESVMCDKYNAYAELLAQGYIFAKQGDDSTYIDPGTMKNEADNENIKNIKVIKCEHGVDFVDGKCPRCGFTCTKHEYSEGKCKNCGRAIVANDWKNYYVSLNEAFANVADKDNILVTADLPEETLTFNNNKEVTLELYNRPVKGSADNAATLTVESGKLTVINGIEGSTVVNDPAVITNSGKGFAASVTGGTLAFGGKATLTGGLQVIRGGKLEGGLKEGSILIAGTGNAMEGGNASSVSVRDSVNNQNYGVVLDLLGEGLAFAKYDKVTKATGDIVSGNNPNLTEDVIVVECTHQNGDASLFENGTCKGCGYVCPHENLTDTTCSDCGAQMVAQVGVSYYSTLAAAIEAAKNDGTVTMLEDLEYVKESVTVRNGTKVTINMNAVSWEEGNATSPVLTVDGGDVTLNGGYLVLYDKDSTASGVVVVKSGSLTLGESMVIGNNAWTGPAIVVEGGDLTLGTDTKLYDGMRTSVEGAKLADYLPKGYAFAENYSDGQILNGYVQELNVSIQMVVAPHTHSAGADGKCACGFTCSEHEFVNGVCKNCGYVCPHEHVTETRDEARHTTASCGDCSEQMAVKVTSSGTATYYAKKSTDPYGDNTLQTLLNDDAITPSDCTVTLLMSDLWAFAFVDGGKNITLDLNGKNLTETGNGICVDYNSTLTVTGEGSSSVDGHYDLPFVFNVRGGTLEFDVFDFGGTFNGIRVGNDYLTKTPGTLTSPRELEDAIHIGRLQIDDANAKISFKAAAFDKIVFSRNSGSVTLGDLLGMWQDSEKNPVRSGNAFQYTTGDKAFVRYNTVIDQKNPVENVKTVACLHDSVTDRTCDYCGTEHLAAVVIDGGGSIWNFPAKDGSDQAKETAVGYALNSWNDTGNNRTLKLFVDLVIENDVTLNAVNSYSTSKPIKTQRTIDLNGHKITGGTLTANDLVTLTITDNSASKGSFAANVTVNVGGTLIVDGVTVGKITAADRAAKITLKEGTTFTDYSKAQGMILADWIEDGYYVKNGDFYARLDDDSNTAGGSGNYEVVKAPATITASSKNGEISYGGYVPTTLLPTIAPTGTTPASYTINWFRRTDTEIKHISSGVLKDGVFAYNENNYRDFKGVTASDTLKDVFCVIRAVDSKGVTLWQTVVTGYTLTVTKGKATVTKAPTAIGNLTYTGSAQELVVKGIADGNILSTMQYSLDGETWQDNTIPTGTDAKEYIVWYRAAGDENRDSSTPQSIRVTIAPKEVTNPTIVIASGSTYDGEEQKPDVTVKDGGNTIDPNEYTVSYIGNINAGEGTVTITDKDGGNYTVNGSAKFSIAKAQAPKLNNVTYSRKCTVITAQSLSLTDLEMPSDAGTLTYQKGTETTSGSVTVSSWSVDSTGTVTYTLTGGQVNDAVTLCVKIGSTNYMDTTVNITITLTDRDTPTVAANAITVTYDGSAVSADKITGSAAFNGKTVDGTWSWKDGQARTNVGDSGEKTVVFTPTDAVNYKPVETTTELTIEPIVVTVTGVIAPDKVYDSQNWLDVGAVDCSKAVLEGVLNEDSVSVQIDPACASSCRYSSKNAGAVTAHLMLKLTGADVGNYQLDTAELRIPAKITPKDVTITGVTAESKTYDGSTTAKNPSASITDVISGDDVQLMIGEASFADKNVGTGKTVRFSQLSLTGTDAANYNLITTGPVTATADITAKKLESFSITEKETKYYDGTNKLNVTKVTVFNTVRGDDVYAVVQEAYFTGTDFSASDTAKQYKVMITLGGKDAANYTLSHTPLALYGSAKINKATPTGEPKFTEIKTGGKTLDDAALTLIGSTISLNNGETVSLADGRLEWIDEEGNVLSGSTRVEANKTYKWRFTPTNANYTVLEGETQLYSGSSGGDRYTRYTVQVTVNGNGTVSPSGWVRVREGLDQTFTITPDKGYAVANVKIDGKSIGAVKSYTLRDVTEDHTIEVIFMKANGNPQTGVFVDAATGSYYEDAVD